MKLPAFLVDHPDGEIRVKGHRISLPDIICFYNEGYSAERLALEYPTLSLATIHKVIAFYLENRKECDRYAKKHERDAERYLRSLPNYKPITTTEIRRRLEQLHRKTKRSA
jgi:uncharacterized protein (DUF433 family)